MVQEEKLNTLIKAAGVEVESYWPSLFAKLFEKVSMEDLVGAIGSAPAGGVAPAAADGEADAAAAPAKEAEEEEKEESEEEEMGFDLFDFD